MDLLKHAGFLKGVQEYIGANPEVAPYVTEFIAAGISAALAVSNERAMDMECALVGLLNMRGKEGKKLTLDKLKKWDGKSSIPWTKTIQKLQE